MKKIFTLLLSVLLLIGCSKTNDALENNDPKPEDTIVEFFDGLQKFDLEQIKGCFKSAEESGSLLTLGEKIPNEYLNSITAITCKIKYEILDSSIENNEATVKVKLTYPDISKKIGGFVGELLSKSFTLLLTGQRLDKNDIMSNFKDMIKDFNVDNLELTSFTMDYKLELIDGTYKIVTLGDEIIDALTGGSFGSLKDLFNQFN